VDEGSFPFSSHGELAGDPVGRHAGSSSYIQGSTRNHGKEWKTDNHGWMLYSRCMLYSWCMEYLVLTHDHGMVR